MESESDLVHCPICNSPPIRKNNLAKHIAKVHPNYDPAKIRSYPYVLGQTVPFEEDRQHEFKAFQPHLDLIQTLVRETEEIFNAFLNTDGGTIYFGIEDKGRILGIQLEREQKDDLRRRISVIIDRFEPKVAPELYELVFVKILGYDSLYIFEIHVKKGTASLYLTGRQNCFIRRDATNYRMGLDEIKKRILHGFIKDPRLGKPRSPHFNAKINAFLQEIRLKSGAAATLDHAESSLGILLAMAFMGWSDKSLAWRELLLILEEARQLEFDEAKIDHLLHAIINPPALKEIAAYLPTEELRIIAAEAACTIALADRVLTIEEITTFKQMCEAFELSSTQMGEIRSACEQRVLLLEAEENL